VWCSGGEILTNWDLTKKKDNKCLREAGVQLLNFCFTKNTKSVAFEWYLPHHYVIFSSGIFSTSLEAKYRK
jgi:hypothetical protein